MFGIFVIGSYFNDLLIPKIPLFNFEFHIESAEQN